jgi:hypothetical protein
MRSHLSPLCLVVAVAALLVTAAPAGAQVMVDGSGEPAYTSSSQNTQFVTWQNPGGGIDGYRLQISYYRDGVLVQETTHDTTLSGTSWINWSGVATLEEGRTYGICVQGRYSFPDDSLYYPDGPNSCSMGAMLGKRTSTTIDRTKPTVSVALADGAASTKSASVPVSIAFSDAAAGPFGATWTCIAAGADPCTEFTYSPSCSVPTAPGRSTTFICSADASQLPDGPVTVCAVAADNSVPDNPSSANQTRTADQANRSDAQCDSVVVDRSVTQQPEQPQLPQQPQQPSGGSADPQQPAAPAGGDRPPAGLRVGAVTLTVPKRVSLRRAKQLLLGAHADQAGQLTVKLVRGKRTYAKRVALLAAGGSKQRLRLPRGLKPGTYAVKVAFREAGKAWSASGAAKVVLQKG